MNPSTYDRDKALAVCARLIEEPYLGLRRILREAGIPHTTFMDWRNAHPELMEAYKEAKQEGYDELAHRSQLTTRGYGPDKGGDSTGDVHRDKLIVDHDLKLLSKWSGKYADKITHANDPAAPFGRETDEELQARFNKLAEKLRAAEQPE